MGNDHLYIFHAQMTVQSFTTNLLTTFWLSSKRQWDTGEKATLSFETSKIMKLLYAVYNLTIINNVTLT